MNFKTTTALVLSLALAFLFAPSLRAQVSGATLTGTITDSQGGVVPNAKISARNAATGVTTESITNSAGAYTIVNLIPAEYEVSVSASGFSTAVSKVTLTVGAKQELSIALTVGQITQTVEVTGAAPIVETTNATLSGTVEASQIVQLPLNGRDWAQLATLEPGVAQVRPHEAVDAPGGSTRGLGMQMTVNGARPQQNVYRLNGVIVNDYSNAGPGNVLGGNMGVDAVQEFSVLTSNYSAEYGFTSGGVINAITRSGTNSFHGSAYEFIRNSAVDANDFFVNAAGQPRGAFVRNQFGGSGGWKVLKDRAFLFGDYEGLRQVKAVPQQGKTLTANARLGIINDKNGTPLPPLVGACPFPNMKNYSPGQAGVCVDNNVAKLLGSGTSGPGLDPFPNGSLIGDKNVGLFNTNGKQAVDDNYGTVRGDLKLSDKDSLAGSWYRDYSTWARPDRLNQGISGFQVPHKAYTAEETHIFSTAMVNTFRLGYNLSDLLSPAISNSNPISHDTSLGMLAGCTAPSVGISSGQSANSSKLTAFGGFTGAQGFYSRTGVEQLYDDVSRTSGNHNFKFGFMFLDVHANWGDGAGCGGSATFTSVANLLQNVTNQVRMPTTPPFTSGPTTHHYRSKIYAGYVQDDWKMRSNLTVNVGVRYEMQTIPTETQGKINQLVNIFQNPGTTCVEDINGLASCPGFYHQTFQANPTLSNFEPRIGFAWDPFKTGKTSIRGGFGLFDVLPLPYMFALNSLQTAPNGTEIDLTHSNQIPQGSYPTGYPALATGPNATTSSSARWGYNEQFPHRNYVMQYNLNIQRQVTSSTSITLAYIGSRGIHNPFQTDDLNTVVPVKTSAGWLFPNPINSGCLPGPPDCSATDAALGLPAGFNNNPSKIVAGLLINPWVSQIQSTVFNAQSWYNSMQVKVDKRLSHGFQVGGSFTWGKSFDTSSSSFAGDNYANNVTPTIPYYDLAITKGLSDFNVTRNLVINALWQVPTPASLGGPLGWVAKGWGMQALLELSDGTPMWPLDSVNAGDAMGQLNSEPMAIPDLVPGCAVTDPSGARHTLQYINPACFIPAQAPSASFFGANCDPNPPFGKNGAPVSLASLGVPALTCFNLLGNLGRNSIIGPGLLNLDYSIAKDNHIRKFGEAFNIQFRAELFNVLNRANFSAVGASNLEALSFDGSAGSGGNFGQLAPPLQTPNREIQFALKLVW